MHILDKEGGSETGGPGRVRVDGVDCYYIETQALNNAQLTVRPGEVIGLVGPNGSGKTTLIKAISGVLRPQVGIITLDDVDVYQIKPKRLAQQMAVVPQSTDMFFLILPSRRSCLWAGTPTSNSSEPNRRTILT